MLRYGTISECDPSKGLARVFFEEDMIVSDWLPIIMRGTLKNRYASWLDTGEHVACMMDENCEDGVVLGAIYSEEDLPEYTIGDKSGVSFENGDFFVYDRAESTYKLKVGPAEVEVVSGKFKIKNQVQDLKTILEDIIEAMGAITVVNSAGTSGVPVNLPSIVAINLKINALLA